MKQNLSWLQKEINKDKEEVINNKKQFIKDIFINNGRTDCLFVPDSSTVQRKQLYKLLEDYGFNRKFLYKQYTY